MMLMATEAVVLHFSVNSNACIRLEGLSCATKNAQIGLSFSQALSRPYCEETQSWFTAPNAEAERQRSSALSQEG
jgi:hypothetical protein